MHHRLIYDSTVPENVPTGSLAIAYVGGRFAWPEDQILRMQAVYRLTEQLDGFVSMGECRGYAVELNAGSVDGAVQACHNRHHHGHDDFTVYTSAAPGPNAVFQPGMVGMVQALRAHAPGLPFRLHVADWDGDPGNRPEAEGVAAWAKQYLGNVHNGAYDLSALYGIDDLSRR